MVPLERIELPSSDYKTDVLPFNYRGKNLVDRKRIELLPSACKTDVLPLSLTAQITDYLSYYTPSVKARLWCPL
jgi:hypothetical protein